MFERFLRWIAMTDKMPAHEDVSGKDAQDIDKRFNEVIKGINRQTWAFSIDASQWLRRRKK